MTDLLIVSGLGHTLLVALGLLLYVLATRIGQQRRNPAAALAWVLGIVAFPYLAVPLFIAFGTRKFARPLRQPRRVIQGPQPGPPWAAPVLASLGLAPAVQAQRVAFQADGAQALQALLDTIASARRRLDVCTFILGNDAVGQRVAAALAEAARRGVITRLLIDAVGSMKTRRALLEQLEHSGVRVRRFMPLVHNPMRGRVNLRNHRKLVVADGVRLWSGGRNLAAEYFVSQGAEPAWMDLSYCASGPLAAQAQAQFRADWRAATGYRYVARTAQPVQPRAEGTPVQWVPSGPDHADDTVHALLLAGAYHARERIWAVTPYFVPDDALLAAWCMACRRGVQVRLLVPARSNHRLADWARERALRDLVAAGGEVFLAPHMQHAKAVLIDDDFALAGSLNLDARSLFLNYECMTAFYGPDELRWLHGWCAGEMAGAAHYHSRRPSWLREMAEGVVRAVGFQL
ncbi:MAG: phospholipase D-like domain-containing protein [Acidovorax sp.]